MIEHQSFEAIIEGDRQLVERKEGEDIQHAREYVAIAQKEDALEREQRAVRLVRFEGLVEVTRDWHHGFDASDVPALVPRLAWQSEVGETEIHTVLKRAMEGAVAEGLDFTVPEVPSYRTFDQVIEGAYARPILREMKLGFVYKNAVKSVVRDFLEQRVFALPAGVPLSFSVDAGVDRARVALANLARPEVIEAVCQAIRPALAKTLASDRRVAAPQVSERRSSELPGFPARKKNVLEAPAKTNFDRAAMENADEFRVAALLEQASDVIAWAYNHRSGVKYAIVYDWMGFPVRYFPDFIARIQMGAVIHNVIIEVKGRLDDRDKEKARRGRRYCEMLTEYDREPWHYLMLIENEPAGREDITWWQEQSTQEIADLLRRHEALPLYPEAQTSTSAPPPIAVVETVRNEEEFVDAVPVHDLAAAAGGFGDTQSPQVIGWARIRAKRSLDRKMFVARISGRSMEPSIPDGSWGLFRLFATDAPLPTALDGRRVVVQLRDDADPDTGGQYTIKRWRVTKVNKSGEVQEIELSPDNPAFKPRRLTPTDGDIRIIAEFLEVVG